MGYRTFQLHGRADDAAGMVSVTGVVVHNNIFKDGILFEILTDSSLHGKVDLKVSMAYGSITIDSVTVTYPAVIGGMTGFVGFPQPITQPFLPHRLPLTIDGDLECSFYMHNGPREWIVDGSPQRYMYFESIQEAFKSGAIKPNWGYIPRPLNVNNLDDLSDLKRRRSVLRSYASHSIEN